MRLFVMAGTILNNLLRGPETRMSPKKKRVYDNSTRGRIVNAVEKCIFCGLSPGGDAARTEYEM